MEIDKMELYIIQAKMKIIKQKMAMEKLKNMIIMVDYYLMENI